MLAAADDQPAVESYDRLSEVQVVDQHLHAQRRSAAGDRESDSRLDDRANNGTYSWRQDLVGCHQRPVDIRHDQTHGVRHVLFTGHRQAAVVRDGCALSKMAAHSR